MGSAQDPSLPSLPLMGGGVCGTCWESCVLEGGVMGAGGQVRRGQPSHIKTTAQALPRCMRKSVCIFVGASPQDHISGSPQVSQLRKNPAGNFLTDVTFLAESFL